MNAAHLRRYPHWLDLVNFIGIVTFVAAGGWVGEAISSSQLLHLLSALAMGLCWIPIFDLLRDAVSTRKCRKYD